MTLSYASPFAERYSSKEMLYTFSPDKRYRTWRRLWIALAEEEKRLGLKRITDEHLRELRAHADDIDYDAARKWEEKLKHDVMAHIKAYEGQCPKAKGIIHLGATSMYVVDNTDLVLMRDGLELIERELVNVVAALAAFAKQYAGVPTVAFTHFQPAQFTTVGKRACLWLYDLLLDLDEISERRRSLRFLGVKGTTGTQASFLALFEGDEAKVKKLDLAVTKAMGFEKAYTVSGQTYTRKVDSQIVSALSGIAQSAHKFANDLRLLQHLREVQEPFEDEQVGSSAMAYKRNPMKSERMTSLARFVITLTTNAAFTAASQWFERTLDDSAGKRIAIPEAFLATDAVLQLYLDVAGRLVVNREIIDQNVERELPAIATENILMEAVKAGGDRQELHERIRRHTMEGKGKDLMGRLKKDGAFKAVKGKISSMMRPGQYIGRSASQVEDFLKEEVGPRLAPRRKSLGLKSEVRV
ncbi:MAG TPA: adenylosuccinate lyase [Planctomycetota bacterium]|nr:adenylosuccinate lyase [Planctomycetota bacterium]